MGRSEWLQQVALAATVATMVAGCGGGGGGGGGGGASGPTPSGPAPPAPAPAPPAPAPAPAPAPPAPAPSPSSPSAPSSPPTPPAPGLTLAAGPGDTTAGFRLPTSVVVRDAQGAIVPGATVTARLVAGPAGATLAGTLAAAADASGVATFTDLHLDLAGTGYVVDFAVAGVGSRTTPAFTVAPGVPQRLAFLDQPVGAVAGATQPALRVAAYDRCGNPATGFSGPIALLGPVAPTTGQLQRHIVDATAGVATFSALRVDRAGAWRLTAELRPGLGWTSDPFTVTPGPATRLAALEPDGALPAVPGAIPPARIAAVDALGNVVPSWSAPISVGPGVGGTTTRAPVGGIAVFDDLTTASTQEWVPIEAWSPGLPAMGLVNAPRLRLEWVQGPADVMAGDALPDLVVRVVDPAGQTVTGVSGSLVTEPPLGSASFVGGVARITAPTATLAGTRRLLARALPAFASVGWAPASSAVFTCAPGPVARLAVLSAPRAAVVGAQLPPVVVEAQDAHGNRVPSYGATVTASALGAPVAGTTSRAAVGGAVVFDDLVVQGTTVALSFSGGAPSGGCATWVGPAGGLWTTQLEDPDGPFVEWTVRDAAAPPPTPWRAVTLDVLGDLVRAQGLVVDLGSVAPMTGTRTATTIGGVATFADLSFDLTGAHQLGAFSTGVLPGPDLSVLARPRVTGVTPSAAPPGQAVTFTIDGAGFVPPSGGASIVHLVRPGGGSFATLQMVSCTSTRIVATLDRYTHLEAGDHELWVQGADYAAVRPIISRPSGWRRGVGLDAAEVTSLAVDPLDPDHVLAATRVGLFETRDAGGTWVDASAGIVPTFRSREVRGVAFDPRAPGAVVTNAIGGSYRREAGATAFVPLGDGLASGAIDFHPTRPDVLFDEYGSTSTDGLRTTASLGGAGVAVTVDPSAPSTMWSLRARDGVLRSTQDGFAWELRNGAGAGALPTLAGYGVQAYTLTVDAAGAVYVAVLDQGVWRSTDGGATWSSAGPGAGLRVQALAAAPGAPGVVWATSELGASRTLDGGATWQVPAALPAGSGARFALVASEPARAYLALGSRGVYRTDDGGQTWSSARAGLAGGSVVRVERGPGGAVYARVYGGGLWSSFDGGATWSACAEGGLPAATLVGLVCDPADGRSALATFEGGAVYRTSDAGATWQATAPIPGLSGLYERFPVVEPVPDGAGGFVDGAFVLAGYGGPSGMWRTNDRGATWTAMPAVPAMSYAAIQSLAIDRLDPARWYVTGPDGGLWVAADITQPAPWTRDWTQSDGYELSVGGVGPVSRLYLSRVEGVASSADHGASWGGPVWPLDPIVNLVDDLVEVHTDPRPSDRRYTTCRTYSGSQAISIAVGKKTLELKAKDLIP